MSEPTTTAIPSWGDHVVTSHGEEGRIIELDDEGFARVGLDDKFTQQTIHGKPCGYASTSAWYHIDELKIKS